MVSRNIGGNSLGLIHAGPKVIIRGQRAVQDEDRQIQSSPPIRQKASPPTKEKSPIFARPEL